MIFIERENDESMVLFTPTIGMNFTTKKFCGIFTAVDMFAILAPLLVWQRAKIFLLFAFANRDRSDRPARYIWMRAN